MAAIPTILKGDDSGPITLTLATGRVYTNARLVIAYQGVTRVFTNLTPGGVLSFAFTHDETSGFDVKTAPILMRLIGQYGAEETVENAEARIKVTECLSEVNAGGSFIVRPGEQGGDKVPITDIGDMPNRYTLAQLTEKVNQIVHVLAQRSLLALAVLLSCACCLSASASVLTSRLDELDNDSHVVTGVSGFVTTETDPTVAEWARNGQPQPQTSLEPATNYTVTATNDLAVTLRGEIAAQTPGNYAIVSNNAMTALQSHQSLEPATNYTVTATNDLADTLRSEIEAHTPGDYENVSNLATSAIQPDDVVDSTSSGEVQKPLSANMGRELQDQITNLKARGRYLSIWNSTSGLAVTQPTASPYLYKSGDYFIVGTVGTNANYRPQGSHYTNDVPSSSVETNAVSQNDTYYYDGSVWVLVHTEQREVSFSSLAGSPFDNSSLGSELEARQLKSNIYSTWRSTTDGKHYPSDTLFQSQINGRIKDPGTGRSKGKVLTVTGANNHDISWDYPPVRDLSPATNYTDDCCLTLAQTTGQYVDSSCLALAVAQTNYTDTSTNDLGVALRREISSRAPGQDWSHYKATHDIDLDGHSVKLGRNDRYILSIDEETNLVFRAGGMNGMVLGFHGTAVTNALVITGFMLTNGIVSIDFALDSDEFDPDSLDVEEKFIINQGMWASVDSSRYVLKSRSAVSIQAPTSTVLSAFYRLKYGGITSAVLTVTLSGQVSIAGDFSVNGTNIVSWMHQQEADISGKTTPENVVSVFNENADCLLTNITETTFTLASGTIGNVILSPEQNALNLNLAYPQANNRSFDAFLRVVTPSNTVLNVSTSNTDVDGSDWRTIPAGTNYVSVTRTAYVDGRSIVSIAIREVK